MGDSIKPKVLEEFNNQFFELVDDIYRIFPSHYEIQTSRMFMRLMSKMKPACIIEFVKAYIIAPYGSYIKEGNLDFFSNNDFSNDSNVGGSGYVLDKIKTVISYINMMSAIEKENVVRYLQNMTELCELYYSSL
jgi:hypothetical protein